MVRLMIAALLALASSAHAQEGNARRGMTLANNLCAECHVVAAGGRAANPRAPAFAVLANTPGISSLALSAALQTSHRTMPNLIITGDDAADVIAYILSLRTRQR